MPGDSQVGKGKGEILSIFYRLRLDLGRQEIFSAILSSDTCNGQQRSDVGVIITVM